MNNKSNRSEKVPRFEVGTRHWKSPSYKVECVVVDILTTLNMAGDVVSIRYVSEHLLMGQTVRNSDVLETTIARNLIP